MPTYITGNSNYPDNFDLVPTGATTPTVSYVLDQLRDSGTGIVSQSGDYVIAKQINSIYTIIQRIEETVGINPEDVFNTLADRLNYLQYSGNLAFVPITGGHMLGDLVVTGSAALNVNTINSSGLDWTLTGTANINSSGQFNIDAVQGFYVTSTGNNASFTVADFLVNSAVAQLVGTSSLQLSGSTVDILSTGNIVSHTNIIPSQSGIYNLGSPTKKWANVYADNIIATGLTTFLTGTFVSKTGDTMSGTYVLQTGSSILNATSGTNDFGSAAFPFQGVYAKTVHATNITGMSPINVLSDLHINSGSSLVLDSGSNLTMGASGSINIGSVSNPVGTLYVNSLVSNVNFSNLVQVTGSKMTGSLTMGSGANIVLQSGSIYPLTSGLGTVGQSGNRFDNVYTNKINDRSVGNFVFNEIAGGTANGVNKIFSLAHAPVSNYAMVFVSGLLIAPTSQYVVSGTALTLTGTMYAPTTAPVAGFYIY